MKASIWTPIYQHHNYIFVELSAKKVKRRAILKSGVILPAASALSGVAKALPTSGDFHKSAILNQHSSAHNFPIIIDRELEQGHFFSESLASLGISAIDVGETLGFEWLTLIEPALKSNGQFLAGMTKGAPLFCMEYLAQSYGLAPVMRIEHRSHKDSLMTHVMSGKGTEVSAFEKVLNTAGKRWPMAAAKLLAEAIQGRAEQSSLDFVDLSGKSTESAPSIYTWLLAPRVQG